MCNVYGPQRPMAYPFTPSYTHQLLKKTSVTYGKIQITLYHTLHVYFLYASLVKNQCLNSIIQTVIHHSVSFQLLICSSFYSLFIMFLFSIHKWKMQYIALKIKQKYNYNIIKLNRFTLYTNQIMAAYQAAQLCASLATFKFSCLFHGVSPIFYFYLFTDTLLQFPFPYS